MSSLDAATQGDMRSTRFGGRPAGHQVSMAILTRLLHPRSMLNPISRLALATFAWNHRHEILRWGRSLYEQLLSRDVSPARAARTGKLLYAIASDDDLRNAKQLRKVTMIDDDVDLDVDERWSHLPTLLERVRSVSGVRNITINGRTTAAASRRIA